MHDGVEKDTTDMDMDSRAVMPGKDTKEMDSRASPLQAKSESSMIEHTSHLDEAESMMAALENSLHDIQG